MTAVKAPSPFRIDCLDVFRGFAIAAMIMVNNPGSRQHAYPFLQHAGWTGCALADLVFPLFLFAIGASAACSLRAHVGTGSGMSAQYMLRVVRRSMILFLLGFFLSAFPKLFLWLFYNQPFSFDTVRIMGVLQRISITYLGAIILARVLSPRLLLCLSCILLLLYWPAMMINPASFTMLDVLVQESNPAYYIDALILGASHLQRPDAADPEGILSTLPALASVIFGYLAGRFLIHAPRTSAASIRLFTAGALSMLAGYSWGMIFPVCKDLWTSPYVLATTGWSLLILSLCYEITEVRRFSSAAWPFQVMGRNAILLFAGSGIAARVLLNTRADFGGAAINLWTWLYKSCFTSWISDKNLSSLAFTAAYLFSWWLILYFLYRRRLFIKI